MQSLPRKPFNQFSGVCLGLRFDGIASASVYVLCLTLLYSALLCLTMLSSTYASLPSHPYLDLHFSLCSLN